MIVSNESYKGDVLSVKKEDKQNLESSLKKLQKLWILRECYLHTLWQNNELPKLYENNEVIVPENFNVPEGLYKKYRKRFLQSRKIDRKKITGHLQGKSKAIKFVSVNANKSKTACIENKLYLQELKKFDVGKAVLMDEALKKSGISFEKTPDCIKDKFKRLPFKSEISPNAEGNHKVTSYYFVNHSIVDCNDEVLIPQIFEMALSNTTFSISYEVNRVPDQLYKIRLSIFLDKISS